MATTAALSRPAHNDADTVRARFGKRIGKRSAQAF